MKMLTKHYSKKELKLMIKALKKENEFLKKENTRLQESYDLVMKNQSTMIEQLNHSTTTIRELKVSDSTNRYYANIAKEIFGDWEDMLAFKLGYDKYLSETENPLDILGFIIDGNLVRTKLFACFGEFTSSLSENICERVVNCIETYGQDAVKVFFETLEDNLEEQLIPLMESLSDIEDYEYEEQNEDPLPAIGDISEYVEADKLFHKIEDEDEVVENLDADQEKVLCELMDFPGYIKSKLFPPQTVEITPRSNEQENLNDLYNKYVETLDLLIDPEMYKYKFQDYIIDHDNPDVIVNAYINAYNTWIEHAISICTSLNTSEYNNANTVDELAKVIKYRYNELSSKNKDLPIVDDKFINSFTKAVFNCFRYSYNEEGEFDLLYDRTKDKYDSLSILVIYAFKEAIVRSGKNFDELLDYFVENIKLCTRFVTNAHIRLLLYGMDNATDYNKFSVAADIISEIIDKRSNTESLDAAFNIMIRNNDEIQYSKFSGTLSDLVEFTMKISGPLHTLLPFVPLDTIIQMAKSNISDLIDSDILIEIGNEENIECKTFAITNYTAFVTKLFNYDNALTLNFLSATLYYKLNSYTDSVLISVVSDHYNEIENIDCNPYYIDIKKVVTSYGYNMDDACDVIIKIIGSRLTCRKLIVKIPMIKFISKLSKKFDFNLIKDMTIFKDEYFSIYADPCEKYSFSYADFKKNIAKTIRETNGMKLVKDTNKSKSPYYISAKLKNEVISWGKEKQLQFLEDCKSGEYDNATLLHKYDIPCNKSNKSMIVYFICIDLFEGAYNPKEYLNVKKKSNKTVKTVEDVVDEFGRKINISLKLRNAIDDWGKEKQLEYLEDCKNKENRNAMLIDKYNLKNDGEKSAAVYYICYYALKDEKLNPQDYFTTNRKRRCDERPKEENID